MFGEQHPSQELGDFGPSSSVKKPKFSPRGNNRRGGTGNSFSSGQRVREEPDDNDDDDEDSEEGETEQTPYNELLTLFKSRKGLKKDVQILSDEEEEDDDEDEQEQEDSDGDDKEEDDDDQSDVGEISDTENDKNSVLINKSTSIPDSTDVANTEEDADGETLEETVIEEAEINPDVVLSI